ncbi:hypothetical protein [Pseudomonas luteola]|uniref:hypothetical protein n=1 Tax=Pseudomonas luteola TaxID=47886 RepID=UPI00289EB4A4|nr:hypothetical protein [Pseudomonas luteola]
MVGIRRDGFWLDIDDEEQRKWALDYLRKKEVLLNGRFIANRESFIGWLKQEREQVESGILIRMERAWDQRKRRKTDTSAGKKRCNVVISAKSKRQLEHYAKQNKTTIANALEALILEEYEQAGRQKKIAKEAQTKARESTEKLQALSPILLKCLKRLSECIVVMDAKNLSTENLTDEQNNLSAELYKNLSNEFAQGNLLAKLHLLLHRHIDRP